MTLKAILNTLINYLLLGVCFTKQKQQQPKQAFNIFALKTNT